MSKLLPFFFKVYFDGDAPKMYRNQSINGVHYFNRVADDLQLYQKYAPLQELSDIYA